MKILKTKLSLKGNILYLAIGLLLMVYIKDAWFMVFVSIVYLLWLGKINILFPVLVSFLGLLYYLSFFIVQLPTPPPHQGQVVKHHPSGSRMVIRSGVKHYWVITQEKFEIGTMLAFEARPAVSYVPDLLGAFDRPSYDQARGISGTYFIDDIHVIDQRFTLHVIPERVSRYIDQKFTFMQPYLRAFILADRSAFDEDLNHSVNRLGISHIFAISGLHITFLAMVLDTSLKKVISAKPRLYGILSVLLGYGFLVGFTPSFIRASFLFGFIQFQKQKAEGYTPLDGLAIIFIVMMIFRPYSLSDSGFILSYLVTFGLIAMSPYLKGPSALFKVSLIAFIMTLPVLMWMHGSVNVSSLFFNTIYVLALTFLILPASYLIFFLPFLEPFLEGVVVIFEAATLFFFHHFYRPITIPFLFGFNVVIYYAIVLWCLAYPKNIKGYMVYAGFLASVFLLRPLNPFQQITILDVDGDAMIFEDRFARCVGLIDGGGPASAEATLKHLKLMGYRTFDIIIVTHDHRDHTTGIEALLNDPYFKVKHLLTEKNAEEVLRQEPCGHLLLIHYPFKAFPSKNDRSLVTGIIMDDFSVLIAGDIEHLGEMHFIQSPAYAYTYLQLPHHGSNTSSSDAFLDHVKPSLAWANLPYQNRHGFPHGAVIERLETRNIPYITTEEKGTFIIRNRHFKP